MYNVSTEVSISKRLFYIEQILYFVFFFLFDIGRGKLGIHKQRRLEH